MFALREFGREYVCVQGKLQNLANVNRKHHSFASPVCVRPSGLLMSDQLRRHLALEEPERMRWATSNRLLDQKQLGE